MTREQNNIKGNKNINVKSGPSKQYLDLTLFAKHLPTTKVLMLLKDVKAQALVPTLLEFQTQLSQNKELLSQQASLNLEDSDETGSRSDKIKINCISLHFSVSYPYP